MKCPRCNVDLTASDLGEYGFVVLDTCPTCKGAWFDKGELDRLDKSVWTNVEELPFKAAQEGREPVACPKCSSEMQPISPADAPALVVDRCACCGGFWLDAGELDKMREVALAADDEAVKHMRHYRKPDDWSYLRWFIYCFKTFR